VEPRIEKEVEKPKTRISRNEGNMESIQDSVVTQERQPGLTRKLGLLDSAALVIGVIIGSGIFLVPGSVAGQLGSLAAVVGVWVTGGVLSMFGGLALAELGASMPTAGGLYVYIERAYGRFVGFIYGWMGLAVINTGSVATMAVGAGSYVAPLVHFSAVEQKLFQIALIAFFTTINCLGVTLAKWVQNALSLTKLGGLGLMIIFLLTHGSRARLTNHLWSSAEGFQLAPFGVALIGVLWAYDGWHVISFAAGEVKNPTRNIPGSLILGTLACVVVYVLANISYYSVLEPSAVRASDRVAAVAVGSAMGSSAASILTILIVVSILGAINGSTFSTPRATMAMANDGLFFHAFGWISPKYHTPGAALVIHGVWAAALTLMGTFQELFTAVIFTAWIFYGLAVLGVVLLRFKEPDLPRPYTCPWYPIPPVLFVVATLGIVLNTVVTDWKHALMSLALIAVGQPKIRAERHTLHSLSTEHLSTCHRCVPTRLLWVQLWVPVVWPLLQSRQKCGVLRQNRSLQWGLCESAFLAACWRLPARCAESLVASRQFSRMRIAPSSRASLELGRKYSFATCGD
jgi:APA family basic amino acid/polyamine antiporter